MKYHVPTQTLAAALMTLGVMGLSSEALAASKTVIHGSDCENIYPPNSSLGTDLYNSTWGLRNASSGWRYVVCPIPNVQGLSTGTLTDVDVAVNSTDPEMWCRVSSYDRYLNTGNATALREANGTGRRNIDFGNPGLTSYYEGSFFVFCVLPVGGSILSIAVDQN